MALCDAAIYIATQTVFNVVSPKDGKYHAHLVCRRDKDSADAFAALAKALGYETEVAYDGAAANALIATISFGAIFLDISLPDADGRDLCAGIRASTTSRHACIFAVVAVH